MKAKVKARLYKDTDGFWRFRLVARNGRTVSPSEGYHNKQDAKDTVKAINQNIEIVEEVE